MVEVVSALGVEVEVMVEFWVDLAVQPFSLVMVTITTNGHLGLHADGHTAEMDGGAVLVVSGHSV